MNWTERQIHFIVQDLIEENPLACRGLFKVSAIRFTDKVDTMAVSLSSSPVLYINLDFCRKHLESESDVKAVLLHEFLHVLLLHTEKYTCSSPLLNICLDAIINAIIYRNMGVEYAGFFVRFYKWEKMSFLLRPQGNKQPLEREWMEIHKRIYDGKYCADDLHELLDYLRSKMKIPNYEMIVLLGNHEGIDRNVSSESGEILDKILGKMKGVKIWNKRKGPAQSEKINKEAIEAKEFQDHIWDAATIKVLKNCFVKDEKKKEDLVSTEIRTPVLTWNDKRSLSKYLWSGLMPFSADISNHYRSSPVEKAHVYLDVSGSMQGEINRLVSLLYHFRKFVKRPLWVFSDNVKEAIFIGELLQYDTSYGTRIGPVFDHMRENRISRALIVTDGYVDDIDDSMLLGINRNEIKVLLSAEGNPDKFEQKGIEYIRLELLPNKT